MRIGYDAKRFFQNFSGLGNYSRDLIRIMQSHYPSNEYLLYTPKRPALASPLDIRYPRRGLLNRSFPSFWRSKGIVSDLKEDHVDVFHGLSGEIPIGIHRSHIKSVVSIHDLIFLRYPHLYKAIDRQIYIRKFRYAAEHADIVVAISQQTKQDIMHYFGVAEDRIQVIYQGCHPAFKIEKTYQEKAVIRQKYNLPQDFILNVGSIEPRKNAFQIVKAVEKLDIPLVIIGRHTDYAGQIKQYATDRGIAHRILFTKVTDMEDLSAIYQLAQIFVYPSSYEGFGIPIIEALYSGTPVITTAGGVFPEAAGPSSCYIDPNNVEKITHSIEHVLSSRGRQQEMGEKGLQYVQRFNDDILAKQWIEVYNR